MPTCAHCGRPMVVTYNDFFYPEKACCSPACLDALHARLRYEVLSKQFQLLRGWIDCAGKCRTWRVTDSNGSHIAEVTRKRDGLNLISLLSGNGRVTHV